MHSLFATSGQQQRHRYSQVDVTEVLEELWSRHGVEVRAYNMVRDIKSKVTRRSSCELSDTKDRQKVKGARIQEAASQQQEFEGIFQAEPTGEGYSYERYIESTFSEGSLPLQGTRHIT